MKRLSLVLLGLSFPAFAGVDRVEDCFPKNDLHLEDSLDRKDANITDVEDYYSSIVSSHGANLVVEKKWNDSTVNAYASQSGSTWNVAMFGGLARRPEVTDDGFAMVVCHELGHHLAGFPFKGERWAATEGQSDYFATQACAAKIWEDQTELNATFRESTPQFAKDKCDQVFTETDRQNLCYRSAMAGKSLAELLAALGGSSVPQFETPDARTVEDTNEAHPAGQCRLDTYFNGALCNNLFPDLEIPGKKHSDGQGSMGAERLAALKSCTDAGFYNIGKRPRCWYAPKLALSVDKDAVTKTEIVGNGNDIWEPGESFGINIPLVNNLLAPISGATLTIEENLVESNYPTIESGESAYADEDFTFGTPRSRQCGDRFSLTATVSANNWSKETILGFMMGGYVSDELISEEPGLSIPDNFPAGVMTSFMATSQNDTSMVNVTVDIEHTYIGDLKMWLISPTGKNYLFYNKAGGSAKNLKQTFNVEVESEKIEGEWELRVADVENNDSGKINALALDFSKFQCEAGLTLLTSK